MKHFYFKQVNLTQIIFLHIVLMLKFYLILRITLYLIRDTRSYSKKKEKSIKPFDPRMKSMLQQSKISVKNINQDIFPKTPPWILEKPEVILQLNELPKTKTHPCTYIEKFHHIVSHYAEHLHIFTDGSKDHSRTARVAVLNKVIHKKALPMENSIFTAEVFFIDLALNIISRDKHNKFIIFSDSLSVLTSLEIKSWRTH